jgi:hypothetical protein
MPLTLLRKGFCGQEGVCGLQSSGVLLGVSWLLVTDFLRQHIVIVFKDEAILGLLYGA